MWGQLGQILLLIVFVILTCLAAVMLLLRKLYLKAAEKAKDPEEAKISRELAKLATVMSVVCGGAGALLLCTTLF